MYALPWCRMVHVLAIVYKQTGIPPQISYLITEGEQTFPSANDHITLQD